MYCIQLAKYSLWAKFGFNKIGSAALALKQKSFRRCKRSNSQQDRVGFLCGEQQYEKFPSSDRQRTKTRISYTLHGTRISRPTHSPSLHKESVIWYTATDSTGFLSKKTKRCKSGSQNYILEKVVDLIFHWYQLPKKRCGTVRNGDEHLSKFIFSLIWSAAIQVEMQGHLL